MMNMRKKDKKGFTLVELMAAILIGSILIITVMVISIGYFRVWINNSQQVELQNDAIFITDLISRTVRPAALANITVPAPATVSDNTLTVGNRSFYINLANGMLMYDPDTTVDGNEIALSPVFVPAAPPATQLFTRTDALKQVTATITLQSRHDATKTLHLTFSVSCRNQ